MAKSRQSTIYSVTPTLRKELFTKGKNLAARSVFPHSISLGPALFSGRNLVFTPFRSATRLKTEPPSPASQTSDSDQPSKRKPPIHFSKFSSPPPPVPFLPVTPFGFAGIDSFARKNDSPTSIS